ncbi:MAG TPA: hypothetical protein VFG76_05495 [Candidatus Polarisedimenticolia bacterium]|nr:hypothetical protein [Candidatus Polarisedimenticolia bacterium]
MILKPPRAPLWIRIVSLLGALVVAGYLATLILTFGYYASGLAAYQEDERRRKEAPIPVKFEEPKDAPKSRD